jgi:DNA-binding NtrC family response regulator
MLNKSAEDGEKIPAIIMTSFNDMRTAVKAMQAGAIVFAFLCLNPALKNTNPKSIIYFWPNQKRPVRDSL